MRESKSRKQEKATEQLAALNELHELIKPGDTIYTILRHVSRSGMSRVIDAFIQTEDGPFPVGWLMARAGGLKFDRDRGGVVMGGCGMDMGFELVYETSRRMFRAGFGCVGEKCPSNDHFNGDRDYRPHMDDTPQTAEEVGTDIPRQRAYRHWHQDGGYALRQRWV